MSSFLPRYFFFSILLLLPHSPFKDETPVKIISVTVPAALKHDKLKFWQSEGGGLFQNELG